MDMERVEQWLSHLASVGRKPETIRTYREGIRRMCGTLERAGRSTEPEDIGVDEMYWLKAERSDLTEASRRIGLWTVGAYVEWATGRNPYKDAKLLWGNLGYCPNRIYVSREDIHAIDEAADDPTAHMILVLGSCLGLRKSEMAALNLSDFHRGMVHVIGKGHAEGKEDELPVPPAVAKALEEYMPYRQRLIDSAIRDETNGALLIHARGGVAQRISSQMVYTRIKRPSKELGITISPHALRRRFATDLYERGVDLKDIKDLMRHDSVDTTITCYIQPSRDRLSKIMDDIEFRWRIRLLQTHFKPFI